MAHLHSWFMDATISLSIQKPLLSPTKKGETHTHTLTNQESRMKSLHLSRNSFISPQLITNISQQPRKQQQTGRNLKPHAAKSGGLSLKSVASKCQKCKGQGAIECPGCKGTGKNKKNGNIFERWKCFECQGFGLKGCPVCGKGGLTPEQRGER